MAIKVVIVEDQILTEAFINKRINEQLDYNSKIIGDCAAGVISIQRFEELKSQSDFQYSYFQRLKDKLKLIIQ